MSKNRTSSISEKYRSRSSAPAHPRKNSKTLRKPRTKAQTSKKSKPKPKSLNHSLFAKQLLHNYSQVKEFLANNKTESIRMHSFIRNYVEIKRDYATRLQTLLANTRKHQSGSGSINAAWEAILDALEESASSNMFACDVSQNSLLIPLSNLEIGLETEHVAGNLFKADEELLVNSPIEKMSYEMLKREKRCQRLLRTAKIIEDSGIEESRTFTESRTFAGNHMISAVKAYISYAEYECSQYYSECVQTALKGSFLPPLLEQCEKSEVIRREKLSNVLKEFFRLENNTKKSEMKALDNVRKAVMKINAKKDLEEFVADTYVHVLY